MLWQIFVCTLQVFAECMGYNFVIKALFYAQCVDIFVTRFLFCESPGCYVTKNPI